MTVRQSWATTGITLPGEDSKYIGILIFEEEQREWIHTNLPEHWVRIDREKYYIKDELFLLFAICWSNQKFKINL